MHPILPTVCRQNPLGKMPDLVLEDGSSLYDSRVIAEYLDYLAGGGRIIPIIKPRASRPCGCRALRDQRRRCLIRYQTFHRPEHLRYRLGQAIESSPPPATVRWLISRSPVRLAILICVSLAHGEKTASVSRGLRNLRTPSPPSTRRRSNPALTHMALFREICSAKKRSCQRYCWQFRWRVRSPPAEGPVCAAEMAGVDPPPSSCWDPSASADWPRRSPVSRRPCRRRNRLRRSSCRPASRRRRSLSRTTPRPRASLRP